MSQQPPPRPSGDKEPQSLTLKVMRLSKPSFEVSLPIFCEKGEILDALSSGDEAETFQSFGVADVLTLPHAFGNIFLGETFTGYVSVSNISPFDVKSVVIQVELESKQHKMVLLDLSQKPIESFRSQQSHDFVVEQMVQEDKTHVLICNVKYVKHDGQRKSFRKYFKFDVVNPLDIGANVHVAKFESNASTIITIPVKNVTRSTLYIENAKFEANPIFSLTDLSVSRKSQELVCLKGNDVYQFLFQLDYKNSNDQKNLDASALGSFEITWKSNLGESGTLSRGTIQRKLPPPMDVDVLVKEIPTSILLEEPFVIQCEVVNRTQYEMEPQLLFSANKMKGMTPCGKVGQNLGKIAPGCSQQVPITLLPLQPGVHKIGGLRIFDKRTTKVYDFDDVGSIFCLQSSIPPKELIFPF